MDFLSRRFLSLPVAAVVLLQSAGATTPTWPAITHPAAGHATAPRSAAVACPSPSGRTVPTTTVAASGIVVQGHGWGHGLGMSQYGAQGAARLGCTHAQILRAYFAGTRLARSAMTAPVELRLHTAVRRSIVFPESAPVRWTVDGRILTQPARTTWTVTATGGLTTLTADDGTRLAQIGSGRTLQLLHAGTVVRLRSFTSSAPAAISVVDLRLRQGDLTFTAGTTTVTVSETISGDAHGSSVDRYLWGLGEVPVSWPQAALRAQADAARTYLTHAYDSRLRRYTIGVTTAAQVYAGADHEDTDTRNGSPWRSAVVETHDEVVVDSRGAPIWAVYSSSGGGRVESRAYVYGGQDGYGYLLGLDDSRWDLASDNPRRSWARLFAPDDLARRLGFTTLQTVSLAAPGTSGRADGLVVTGVRSGGTVTARFTGDQIRNRLGLPSPVIDITWTAGRPTTSTPGSTSTGSGPARRQPSAGPATAPITGSFRSAACHGTSCGHVTARFSGTRALADVQESVQDATCNHRRAYVRLQVRYTDGTWQLTPPRYAANRCRPPATVYPGLSWRAARPIAGFTVIVGEASSSGLTGPYVDNPNT